MFDTVTFNISNQWFEPDLGDLAEVLVFYDQVNIAGTYGQIKDLLPFDLDDLEFFVELLEDRVITLTVDQLPLGEVALEMGLVSNPFGARRRKLMTPPGQKYTASLEVARRDLAAAYLPEMRFPLKYALNRGARQQQRVERLWERIVASTNDLSIGGEPYITSLIDRAETSMAFFSDDAFLRRAAETYGDVKHDIGLIGVRPIEIDFDGRPMTGLETNGPSGSLLPFLSWFELLLSAVESDAYRDAYSTAQFEAWATRMIVDSVHPHSVRNDLENFQESVFGRASIGAAIRSGRRSFRDLAPILKKREPLAGVVRRRAEDTSLAEAYFTEVSRSTIEKGLSKAVRWTLIAAGGAVVGAALAGPSGALAGPIGGALAGNVVSAFDTFLLDNIYKGNAAKSFVTRDLQQFVDPED